jgi:hypothetical protein
MPCPALPLPGGGALPYFILPPIFNKKRSFIKISINNKKLLRYNICKIGRLKDIDKDIERY